MQGIHPTAIISPGAKIGSGTTIGAYSVIGPNVELGSGNEVGPHVVIDGYTKIGNRNRIFQFASVGGVPQDLKYKGEPSTLEIGDLNIIREFVTLQPGTAGGGMITKIGSGNLFMANSHVAHDCTIGNRNVFANSAALAGHVTVGSGVIVGGLCAIHQFVRLGDISFLGGGSMVSKDVPPYCIAQGDRARLVGINRVGILRNQGTDEDHLLLRKCYRSIFLKPGTLKGKVQGAKAENPDNRFVKAFLAFFEDTERSITPHRSHSSSSDSNED